MALNASKKLRPIVAAEFCAHTIIFPAASHLSESVTVAQSSTILVIDFVMPGSPLNLTFTSSKVPAFDSLLPAVYIGWNKIVKEFNFISSVNIKRSK